MVDGSERRLGAAYGENVTCEGEGPKLLLFAEMSRIYRSKTWTESR